MITISTRVILTVIMNVVILLIIIFMMLTMQGYYFEDYYSDTKSRRVGKAFVTNQCSFLFTRCDQASSSPASRPEKCWMNLHLTKKSSRLRLLLRPITPSSLKPTSTCLRPSPAPFRPFRSQLLLRLQAPRNQRAPSKLLVLRASPFTRPPDRLLRRQAPLSPKVTSSQRRAAGERPARRGSTRATTHLTQRKMLAAQDRT